MSEIPGPDLKAIAEELLATTDAPHGLPTYAWHYTKERGRRVFLTAQQSESVSGDGSDGGPTTAAVDFEDGPSCRFTYQGREYEAAWRRWFRVVAYRPVKDSDGDRAEG